MTVPFYTGPEEQRAERSRKGQSGAEKSKTEQSRAEKSKTEQSRAERSRAEQKGAERSRKEQNVQKLKEKGAPYFRTEIREATPSPNGIVRVATIPNF